MREMFQTALMHLALCGLAASVALLVLRSRLVRDAFARLVSIWRSLTAFGRVAVCSFLLIGILIGGDKTNSVPPSMNLPLPQMVGGGIIQGGAASCRAGDLRKDSFTWRGGTPHLLGTLPNSLDEAVCAADPTCRHSKRRLAVVRSAQNGCWNPMLTNYVTNAINELVTYPEADLPD